MNRNQITKRLDTLRNTISLIIVDWEDLLNDMQEHFDEKPEHWQMGEKGDEYQGYIDGVQEQIDSLQGVLDFGI